MERRRRGRRGDGRGGESSGRVGGVLRRRMGMHREMDDYARREQAGPWKLWHTVCVCCGGGLLMSARWGPVGVVMVVVVVVVVGVCINATFNTDKGFLLCSDES